MVLLGDEVKDMVSGFTGIAVCRHTYLQGCDRISVQRSVGKDGSLKESMAFDEPQLVVLKAQKVERKASATNTGGPHTYMDGKIKR